MSVLVLMEIDQQTEDSRAMVSRAKRAKRVGFRRIVPAPQSIARFEA
ncbi:MAG: hypothetical protein ACLVKA_03295 [Collinsella aerofaciens]